MHTERALIIKPEVDFKTDPSIISIFQNLSSIFSLTIIDFQTIDFVPNLVQC